VAPGFKAADAFLAMNAARVERAYDAHPSSRSATSSRGASDLQHARRARGATAPAERCGPALQLSYVFQALEAGAKALVQKSEPTHLLNVILAALERAKLRALATTAP
jgi:hypothetical protein